MNRLLFSCLLAACSLQGMAEQGAKGVQVVADEAHQRVDITIDGKPFTSYVWPAVLKKPVLFPTTVRLDLEQNQLVRVACNIWL